MFGCKNGRWKLWPTQPGVCRGDDGIPHRVDRIKGLGNAIVPQIAYIFFKAIMEIEGINNDKNKDRMV